MRKRPALLLSRQTQLVSDDSSDRTCFDRGCIYHSAGYCGMIDPTDESRGGGMMLTSRPNNQTVVRGCKDLDQYF